MIYESLSAFSSKIFFFTSFIRSAQGFPEPLTREEELEYVKRLEKGDKEARDVLINHNLRLVAHIVKKFKNSLEADDLISVGTIGLIKAVDSFHSDKGVQLSTYASRCIENEILMLIRANKKHKDVISINSIIHAKLDGEDLPLEDMMSLDLDDDLLSSVDNNFMLDKVKNIMKEKLTPMEYDVIKYRYGLVDGVSLAQREVAQKLGISRSYISRIEKTALGKLQKEFK